MNPDDHKDYLIQIRIRNAPMKRMMKNAGIETVAELSRRSGVRQAVIGKFFGLKKSPYVRVARSGGRTVKWVYTDQLTVTIIKILRVLDCSVEDIFPPQHLREPLEINSGEFEASLDDVARIAGDTNMVQELEHKEAIERSFATMMPRETWVLRKLYGLDGPRNTLKEVAEMEGVSVERIRQIEGRGLRKMKSRISDMEKNTISESVDKAAVKMFLEANR